MRVIDGDALVDDLKTDYTNLFMNGLKGTPRERCLSIDNIIERIEDAPILSVDEINDELAKVDKIIVPIEDAEKLSKYTKIAGDIIVYDDNAVFLNSASTEYIDKSVSKVFQNMAYRNGVSDLRDKITKCMSTELDLSQEITLSSIHQMVWKLAEECLSERGCKYDTESTEV